MGVVSGGSEPPASGSVTVVYNNHLNSLLTQVRFALYASVHAKIRTEEKCEVLSLNVYKLLYYRVQVQNRKNIHTSVGKKRKENTVIFLSVSDFCITVGRLTTKFP